MENSYIEKLQELTPQLPAITLAEIVDKNDNIALYKDADGKIVCEGFYMFKGMGFAAQRAFMPMNAILQAHFHTEKEILIVYSGCIGVLSGCERKIVNRGQVVEFEPGVEHTIDAMEDTWMIGITIPASEGYPNGNGK